MPARHHADQREQAAADEAGEQPAAAHGRGAEPAERHDEGGGGDMAADEGAVLLALIGRDKGRRELPAAAELFDIDRPGPARMLFQRGIDQQHRAEQGAGQQETEGCPACPEAWQARPETEQPEQQQPDQQALAEPGQAAVGNGQPEILAIQCPVPRAAIEQAAGQQVELWKGDEQPGQQAEGDQYQARFSSP